MTSAPFGVEYDGVPLICAFVGGQPYFEKKTWDKVTGLPGYDSSLRKDIQGIGECYSLHGIVQIIVSESIDEECCNIGNDSSDSDSDVAKMTPSGCLEWFFSGIYPQLHKWSSDGLKVKKLVKVQKEILRNTSNYMSNTKNMIDLLQEKNDNIMEIIHLKEKHIKK
jgi:hypothetical protein